MPIKTFADQTTADVAAGLNTKHARKVPQRVWNAAQRRLDALQAAKTLLDLSAIPGNNLEDLKHTKPGFFSLRVNDQYRVFFRFVNGEAHDVKIDGQDHTGRR